jgi:hypothetical protein
MKIEVSNGEIVDKYTILKIKEAKIKDESKLANVINEIESLNEIVFSIPFEPEDYDELLLVNQKLWDIEDKLRDMEVDKNFGHEFIKYARQVYKLNDYRAEIKKSINISTGSLLVEEKSYICIKCE